MNTQNHVRFTTIATALLAAGVLFGCQSQEQDSKTVGQKLDSTIESTKQAVNEAGDKLDQETDKIRDAAKESASRMSDSISDSSITASIQASFLKDPDLSVLKIDVTTHDGAVELAGKVKTDDAKERAGKIASATDGVKSVTNDLVVESS